MGCRWHTRIHHALLRALPVVLLAGGQLAAGPEPLGAAPSQRAIPLECRLGQGPWQSCRMEVMEIGSRWALVVGGQRWEFRHDGQGGVTVQHGGGAWRLVSSRWVERDSLCWDGVCARGAIPLD